MFVVIDINHPTGIFRMRFYSLWLIYTDTFGLVTSTCVRVNKQCLLIFRENLNYRAFANFQENLNYRLFANFQETLNYRVFANFQENLNYRVFAFNPMLFILNKSIFWLTYWNFDRILLLSQLKQIICHFCLVTEHHRKMPKLEYFFFLFYY